ncbi:hypothetical protein Tco_0894313 [Tanacetum coccineum]|uniref:Uncharacterized protein n=1 Tax=Tanacetum coccineum TaxID=301880 RepID=A0ABQ5CEN6_9ASTR
MITTNNIIEGKKSSGLMLPPQLKTICMLETFPCVKDELFITQDLALSSVRLATRWVIRPGTRKGNIQNSVPKMRKQHGPTEKLDCLRDNERSKAPRSKHIHGYGSFKTTSS